MVKIKIIIYSIKLIINKKLKRLLININNKSKPTFNITNY